MQQQKTTKITDEKVALAKAEHYCAYQDRAQQEVRDKLYEWGMVPASVENIIVKLIEGNFLNEERFAKAYARGKFNQKGWGRIKIKQGLKFKKVPDVLIKKALLLVLGVGLTTSVLFGRNAASYVSTTYHRLTSTVEDAVPVADQS